MFVRWVTVKEASETSGSTTAAIRQAIRRGRIATRPVDPDERPATGPLSQVRYLVAIDDETGATLRPEHIETT